MRQLGDLSRWRLTSLAVLVPLALVAVFLIWQDYQSRRAHVLTNIELKSAQVTAQLEDFVNTTEVLASLFTESFVRQHPDPVAEFGVAPESGIPPNAYLQFFVREHPVYAKAHLLAPDGRVVATSGVLRPTEVVQDERFLASLLGSNAVALSKVGEALAPLDDPSRVVTAAEMAQDQRFLATLVGSNKLVVSDVAVGAAPSVSFGYPLRGPDGLPVAYLVLEAELDAVSALLDLSVGFPDSAKVGIFDSTGTVVAGAGRFPPHPGGAVGTNISGAAVWAQAMTAPAEAWFGPGLDGVDRIIYFDAPEKTPWLTTVAFAQSELFGPLWNRVYLFSGGLLITILGTLALSELARRREQRAWVELARQQQTLLSVVDSANVGMLVVDPAGRVAHVNDQFTALLGLRVAPTVGLSHRRLRMLLRGSQSIAGDRGERVAALLGAHDSDAVESFETTAFDSHEVVVSGYPICNPDGTAAGRTLVVRDVTDERRVQRMKSEFVAHASHELRTPLASVLMSSELLMEPGLDQARRQEYVQLVHSQAQRMRSTINTLINLAQFESGRVPLEIEEISIGEVIAEVVNEAAARTENHEFEIEQRDGSPLVSVDREKIVEVLRSLVDNAVKYSPDGGPITVRVRTLSSDLIAVEVHDSGIGISQQQLKGLFSLYERGSAGSGTVPVSGGTGLGLYLVKSLVELHGGRVWVQSELGVGTMFSFTLPRANWAGTPALNGGPAVAGVAEEAAPAGPAAQQSLSGG